MAKSFRPYLSVVIATHSRPRQLIRALSSIKQRLPVDHEVILVSDTACPQTRSVAAQFLGTNDTFIERPGRPGPAESRNFGLQLIRGEFVLIFDDDDEIPGIGYGEFLESCFKNRTAVSFGNVLIAKEDRGQNLISDEPPQNPNLTTFNLDQLYIKNFIFTQATIFPALALKNRTQDRYMRSLEDWEFLLQIKSEYDFVPIGKGLGAIIYKDFVNPGNRRGSSESANNFDVVLDYIYVYRRWPAPSEQLRRSRRNLLLGSGIDVPEEFL